MHRFQASFIKIFLNKSNKIAPSPSRGYMLSMGLEDTITEEGEP